eukprot:TRINITY_DN8259_c0_g1_i1.p2 TRINITY_DN8259_c0_g1~~TRINITY_DN8259_c0_g1_i1.p2  ORF type:complete len:273 (+),score=44.05 TRINITY_DN8259_c0_g1_i1:904-1722(+)
MLAALADRCLPPTETIDLINVAFGDEKTRFATPDRQTALRALDELRTLSSRCWRFVAVNVTAAEAAASRAHVTQLICPRGGFMNVNIATALWFAASGVGIAVTERVPMGEMLALTGHCVDVTSTAVYRCAARILLLGMGADEQLAGYGRHRKKYATDGWDGLRDELAMEMDRLWLRNLGRDDRVIADHARDGRFPFLAEPVMQFLRSLPLEHICDFRQEPGRGDKRILREAARQIGLVSSCYHKKQAIQFGSRISRYGDVPSNQQQQQQQDQ